MSEYEPKAGEIEMQEIDVNTWPENDKKALLDYIVRNHRSPNWMTQIQYMNSLSEILFEGKKPIDIGLGNLVGVNLRYYVTKSSNRNAPRNTGIFHISFTTDRCVITTRKKESVAPQIESITDVVAQEVGDTVTGNRYPDWLKNQKGHIAIILKKMYDTSLERNLNKFIRSIEGIFLSRLEPFINLMIHKINSTYNNEFKLDDLLEIKLSDNYLCTFLFKGSTKMYHLPNQLGRIIEEEIPAT